MATTEVTIPVSNMRSPTTAGAEVITLSETNQPKYVARYDASSVESMTFSWYIPGNYLTGGLNVDVYWKANATTGAVVWQCGYQSLAHDSSAGFGLAATPTQTTTTDATANDINVSTFNLTTNIAANALITFSLQRNATSVSDTLSVDAELLYVVLRYTSDNLTAKQYLWLPAAAFVLPPGSGASYSTVAVDTTNTVHSILYPNGGGTADYKIHIPYTYNADIKARIVGARPSSVSNTLNMQYSTGAAGILDASDPSLTAGTAFSVPLPDATTDILFSNFQALPTLSPAYEAGDIVSFRLARDSSDSNTGSLHVVGVVFEIAVTTAQGAVITLDPTSGAVPGTGGAIQSTINDTNLSFSATNYPDGSDTSEGFEGNITGIWASGGTVHVWWRSPASSGSGRFRVDYASPASGSPADPSLTTGTAQDVGTNGTDVINHMTFDVSSGIVASDTFNIRLYRLGSHANDTLSAAVYVLKVIVVLDVLT